MIPLAPTPPVPSSPGITVETPDVSQSCRADALCSRVLEITGNQWLANSSYVLIVKPLSRLNFLRIFPSVFKGTHVRHPKVSILRAKNVRIAGDGVIVYADGERIGPAPIDVQVVPGALRVLAPQPA